MPQPSWSPSTTQQLRKLVAAPYLAPNDWTPRSDAYFVFPLAQGTPGKQCGLAATGVYQPSLRSPWLAAFELAPLHGFTQVRLHSCPLHRIAGHFLDIELESAAPGFLRLEHGRIRVAQQGMGVSTVLWIEADANAGAEHKLCVTNDNRLFESRVQPLHTVHSALRFLQ
nr:hypothetical protein [Thiolapillus sp.]